MSVYKIIRIFAFIIVSPLLLLGFPFLILIALLSSKDREEFIEFLKL